MQLVMKIQETIASMAAVLSRPSPSTPQLQYNPEIADAIATGLAEAERAGATGPKATPKILAAIAAATDSRSIPANLALAESNARLAGEIAVALLRG